MARRVEKPIPWLPIDSRLVGSFFAFGHVQGIARIFLTVEMILAVLIVLGTLSVILLTVL
ncbi:MAG: hypothetical protein NT149_01945 [Candidatus Gottesmanbacteria bacterium]|nr:hypothetical protein [Candidatus Gottesmanbacteria bacterium]